MRRNAGTLHSSDNSKNTLHLGRAIHRDTPLGGLPSTRFLDNLKTSRHPLVEDPSVLIHSCEPGQLLIEVDLNGLDPASEDAQTVLLQSIPGTAEVRVTSVGGDESVDLRLIPDESELLVRALELCSNWQRAEKNSIEAYSDIEPNSD